MADTVLRNVIKKIITRKTRKHHKSEYKHGSKQILRNIRKSVKDITNGNEAFGKNLLKPMNVSVKVAGKFSQQLARINEHVHVNAKISIGPGKSNDTTGTAVTGTGNSINFGKRKTVNAIFATDR